MVQPPEEPSSGPIRVLSAIPDQTARESLVEGRLILRLYPSVLLLDVQSQRRWRHQPVAAAAAGNHGDAAAERAPSGVAGGGGGRGGGGRLLQLLLVDLPLLRSAVLEPDLHLETDQNVGIAERGWSV